MILIKQFSYLFTLLIFLNSALFASKKDDVALAGDIVVSLLPTAAISKVVYERDGKGAVEYTATIATTLATTYLLKYTIDAERPNGENNRSFPSGHSSTAFSTATFMQIRYGWQYGVPAYLAATFVAWSRVYSDYHYTRDVIAGGVLGMVSSYVFTTNYKEPINITPIVENGTYGLILSHRFSSY